MSEVDLSHVVILPRWVLFIRIAQAVLALLTLILTAYSASVFGTGAFNGYGLDWFTCIWTGLFLFYVVGSPLWFAKAFNKYAALVLEILSLLLWLITFPVIAAESVGFCYGYYCDYYDVYYKSKRSLAKRDSGTSALQATQAAAGLGGIEFILFLVTLIVYSIFLHRHRRATNARDVEHATPAYVAPAGGPQPAYQEAKPQYEMQNVQQGAPQYPPQQQYAPPQPQAPA